jgi:hypothetical protein
MLKLIATSVLCCCGCFCSPGEACDCGPRCDCGCPCGQAATAKVETAQVPAAAGQTYRTYSYQPAPATYRQPSRPVARGGAFRDAGAKIRGQF